MLNRVEAVIRAFDPCLSCSTHAAGPDAAPHPARAPPTARCWTSCRGTERQWRALVIGYGNPLRQDDGVGWHVAARLRRSSTSEPGRSSRCHQLTPELAEPISRAERVVFVDAREGGRPGRVAFEPVDRTPSSAPRAFSHHVSPTLLLALAAELYGARPDAWTVAIGGAAFGYGTELSKPARAAVEPAAEKVRGLLERQPAPIGAGG